MKTKSFYGIWVFAEQENGVINPVVFELLSKARDLQQQSGEIITAVLLGSNVEGLAAQLFAYGANEVILAQDPALEAYSARPYQKALAQLAEKYRPSILLYPASPLGRDLAPRLMVALDTGLTADAIDLGFDEDGVFYQTTPGYGGKILAHIVIEKTCPQMATVHAGICEPLTPVIGAQGKLIEETVEVEADPAYEVIEEYAAETGTNLASAPVVVACGRGIKTQADLKQMEELASLLGGEVAASRPLVDNGWMPHERQIGQSGITVKPGLIINIGISGSVQYSFGMNKSGCVVSVNHDSDAPIFDISHYGIVADYKAFVPALIKEIKSRKAAE